MRARFLAVPALLVAAATACTAIIGTRDLSYDPNADGGGSSGNPPGTPPPGTPPPGTPPPGSGDGGACNADLQTDMHNCGRCGRDCLGAKCTMGACEPITLAMGLSDLNYIALDATNVYLTTYDGKIWKVPKDGSMQQTAIATSAYALGLVVDGTTLYWASNDYIYNGTTQLGGIWKCTLPACADKAIVSPADEARFPAVAAGVVYFGSDGDQTIRRTLADGGNAIVTSAGRPFTAVDATHVYFTSSANDMYRALIAGDGGTERIGPLNGSTWGYAQVDATRAYWAYGDSDNTAHVLGIDKANITMTPTAYSTTDDKNPVGIALDATNIYWADQGTFTMDMAMTSHNDGMIRMCPKAGCAASGPITLAKGLTDPVEIAVDDKAVYWGEFVDINNCILKKVALP
ncbi:MAG TPA: hypothetical protein VIF62_06855 [Labilithrix sp.]|jgi:hypothetical protein